MGENQKLNTEVLYNTANQVKNNAASFETTLGQLGVLVNTTADACDSPAIKAFVTTYEGYKKSMEAFIASLKQYATEVNNYAADIDAITAAGVKRFESII